MKCIPESVQRSKQSLTQKAGGLTQSCSFYAYQSLNKMTSGTIYMICKSNWQRRQTWSEVVGFFFVQVCAKVPQFLSFQLCVPCGSVLFSSCCLLLPVFVHIPPQLQPACHQVLIFSFVLSVAVPVFVCLQCEIISCF